MCIRDSVYPFHMPGHKRRALPFPNPYTIDITEIDGFDNLHHAEGLIREAEERAAKLYGADRSYYLVNGSTCGLLAAICAAARRGDKVPVSYTHLDVYKRQPGISQRAQQSGSGIVNKHEENAGKIDAQVEDGVTHQFFLSLIHSS